MELRLLGECITADSLFRRHPSLTGVAKESLLRQIDLQTRPLGLLATVNPISISAGKPTELATCWTVNSGLADLGELWCHCLTQQ